MSADMPGSDKYELSRLRSDGNASRNNMKQLTTVLLVIALCLWVPGKVAAFDQWPDTGQTKCYNNSAEIPCPVPGETFYGQDAQFQGPARSFVNLL